MKTCRTVMIEDETLVRSLITMALRENRRFQLVGEAGDGEAGLEVCEREKPDLVLLDMMLPKVTGPDLALRLRGSLPDARILGLSSRSDVEIVRSAVKAGIHGYVVKNAPMEDVLKAMAVVADGGQFFGEEALRAISNNPLAEDSRANIDQLTDREVEVLRAVALGKSVKEISTELFISENTVKMHRQNLMRKVGIHDVVRLTHFAIQHALITVQPTDPAA